MTSRLRPLMDLREQFYLKRIEIVTKQIIEIEKSREEKLAKRNTGQSKDCHQSDTSSTLLSVLPRNAFCSSGIVEDLILLLLDD